jgi:iron(III) transport system permease protein
MESRLSMLRRAWRQITPSAVLYVLLLFLSIIIIFGPLAGLLTELGRLALSGKGLGAFAGLVTERRLILLLQSVGLAAAVAAAGITTGVLVATALWRRSRTISFGVLLLVLALAPIPPYIHALTWSSAISLFNQWLAVLGAAPLPATGWIISFWVQFMALLPIAIFLSFIGLASVDRTLVEAARMVRSDIEVLRTIVLPLAAPTLLAASGFLFVLSCTDYSVPSLFGSDTYALDIFSVYSATGSAGSALVSALPLLLITIIIMTACRSGIRRLAQTPNWTLGAWENPPVFPGYVTILQEGALLLVGLQLAIIVIGLTFALGSLAKLFSTLTFSAHEMGDTLLIVACVVVIGIPLTLAVTRELLRPGFRGSLWWGLILLPVAIPAPLIGIGIIALWNTPILPHLYGTFLMPVFAAISRFAPFAAIILFVQVRSIDPALFDAARIFSRDRIATLTEIILPLLAPGIFIASAVLAALTIGELGATLIVTPPGFGTLAIKIYNYLHYGAAAEVAGLCLVMVAATVLAGLCVAMTVAWRGRNLNNTPKETGEVK